MKPKYTVSICRTAVETRDYEVEAENGDQAAAMAQAKAEDDVWDNYSNAELEIQSISHPNP